MVPEFNAVDREAPAGIQERDKLHKNKKMAEEAGAAPAVPDEGNTCLANKRDDLTSRLSSIKRLKRKMMVPAAGVAPALHEV